MTETVERQRVTTSRHKGTASLALVVFVVGAAAAMFVDVPRTGYGLKSDEATYVAATLSAAYDGNLSYERRDLERFAGLYHSGPEGIFLKRGKVLRLRSSDRFPFVRLSRREDPRSNRLYFGKALIYPVVAAPFVRLLGLNGMLLLHVLLLTAVGVGGYAFLAARSSSAAAALFTTAFLGASVVPVYGVFLLPEVFNFALVFIAYFFWLYKEVAPTSRLSAPWTDAFAALLLGLATYSKPTNAVLITPLVLYAWWRRRWAWGIVVGGVAVLAASVCFVLNAAVSGEFNYQGGDRKTFYTRFPFDAPDATWDHRGLSVTTSGDVQQSVIRDEGSLPRFGHNVVYFLAGRHFGLIPYFFPGALAILAWLFSRARREPWRVLTFLVFVAYALVLLVALPYTWSGGGGPSGNRYLLSAYPALFFLMPPVDSVALGALAWIGGALFTAKMFVSPFVAAKYPYLITEKGPARWLPVELTMVTDLPIMLDSSRPRIPYGHDPTMLLYFLDQNAFPPEPPGMWVSGAGRADIIVRTTDPIRHLDVSAESPIPTVLTVSMGAGSMEVRLTPGQLSTFSVPAGSGVRYQQSHAYVMSVRSSEGIVPHLQDATSRDYRNLGAVMRFSAVTTSQGTP